MKNKFKHRKIYHTYHLYYLGKLHLFNNMKNAIKTAEIRVFKYQNKKRPSYYATKTLPNRIYK